MLCIAAGGTALQTPALAQDDVLRLAPSSGWVMDYADDSCALRRSFGDQQQRVWLELRQFAPSEEFLVTAASDALRVTREKPKSRFEPDGQLREQPLAAFGQYGDNAEGVAFPETLRPDNKTPGVEEWADTQRDARESSVTGLYLDNTFNKEVFLATGELHRPMNAMRTCVNDLLTHLGIDPEADKALSRRAQLRNIGRVARPIQERFPQGLLFIGGDSRVVFRLVVDANGKPADCRVMRPVVDESYQQTICGILTSRAEFEAALDAAGQPVKSYYLLPVVYQAN